VKKRSENRYKTYSMYGFGGSVLLTAVVFSIDFIQMFPSEYLPNIGKYRCWVSKTFRSEGIYIYAPFSLLVVANVVFFLITLFNLWKAQTIASQRLANKPALRAR
jgi:hypothetical protein